MLGDVDPLAREHGVAPLRHARLLGQPQQQVERLVGDAVLRDVEEEPGALGRQPLAAAGVGGEEVAQVQAPHLGQVPLERLPGGPLAEGRGLGDRHARMFPETVGRCRAWGSTAG